MISSDYHNRLILARYLESTDRQWNSEALAVKWQNNPLLPELGSNGFELATIARACHKIRSLKMALRDNRL